MITLNINGLNVSVEEGTTVLEAARFIGFPIPTLCHMDGLSPYGACRVCLVEIGKEPRTKLVSSCTYPAEEGLVVRTASSRVVRTRRMVIELLLASCPQSKVIQDLASSHGVNKQRFKQEHDDCILCGLCVRMCSEQMMAKAIGFSGRGNERALGTPFNVKSEACRQCGGCIYVCPACQLRCSYTEKDSPVCGGCQNLPPPCLEKEKFDDMMCFMSPCVACEIAPK
ncbi:MAG: 2Fe-2S iron-sulfur cluster-binding protein [Deltaproteobacteria bacterium]|nr:2Fe-2S iron-sulfur cluster-binding protein [Deltaproteobacteria bacterium]